MLTISITVAIIVAILLLVVVAYYRKQVSEATEDCEKHVQWIGSTLRKDNKIRAQVVSDLLGGGDCTTVMSKLAKDRSELFPQSSSSPISAWTEEDLQLHAKARSLETKRAAMGRIRNFATVGTIVTTMVCLLVSAGIYSFVSRLPVSDFESFNDLPIENAPILDFSAPAVTSTTPLPIASASKNGTGASSTN